jgi:hypothetical protein
MVTPPRLIVIDGLDECENSAIQCELLRAIARSIPHIPYYLRFLVTSRPEAHITQIFDNDPDLQRIVVHRYNLSDDPDTDMDIRRYLVKEFLDLRQVHHLGSHLPHTWPDQEAISSIVERSSGHFIWESAILSLSQVVNLKMFVHTNIGGRSRGGKWWILRLTMMADEDMIMMTGRIRWLWIRILCWVERRRIHLRRRPCRPTFRLFPKAGWQ